MAEFSKLVITEKGNALLAKAFANTATIKFTKILSSGKGYESGEMETLEALTDIKQIFLEPNVKIVNKTSVEIKAAFNNMGLTEGYYLRTFGLYADDPDEGEILYGVTAETSGNCYIPAYNGITSSGLYLKLLTKVGNSQNVSLEIDPAAVATLGDIEELKEKLEIVDFDDSGEIEGIESFTDFMSLFVSGTNQDQFLANLKAGLKYVLHMGRLVNNGTCETPGEFALDAAYGKTLTDRITGLYSDIEALNSWKASLQITQTTLNTDGSIAYYYTAAGGDKAYKWNPRTDADAPENIKQLLLHNWTGNGTMSYYSNYVVSSIYFNSAVTSCYNYSPYIKIPYNAYLSVACTTLVTSGNYGYTVTFQVVKSDGTVLYSSSQDMLALFKAGVTSGYTFTTGNLAINEGDSVQIRCSGAVQHVGWCTGGTMTVSSLTITER